MFANRGEVVVSLVGDDGRQGVTVVARDAGPGIPDLERALQDGYSGYGGDGAGPARLAAADGRVRDFL